LTKGERPSMVQFLDFCFRLNMQPAYVGQMDERAVGVFSSSSRDRLKSRGRCRRLTREQRQDICAKLETYLADTRCLPVSQIAAFLDVPARCLRYWFPDLCASLSKRARIAKCQRSAAHQARQSDRVREIIRQLRQVGRYSSRRQISTILRREGMSLAQPHLLLIRHRFVELTFPQAA
jgi:hypothetical protein